MSHVQPPHPQWQRGPDGRWYPVYPPPQRQPPPPVYRYPPPLVTHVTQQVRTPQRPFAIRLLYFVFIGWWLALLWLSVALLCLATILGIPVGIIMLNMLPAVLTLQRH